MAVYGLLCCVVLFRRERPFQRWLLPPPLNYTAQQSRRQLFSYASPWEPVISHFKMQMQPQQPTGHLELLVWRAGQTQLTREEKKKTPERRNKFKCDALSLYATPSMRLDDRKMPCPTLRGKRILQPFTTESFWILFQRKTFCFHYSYSTRKTQHSVISIRYVIAWTMDVRQKDDGGANEAGWRP